MNRPSRCFVFSVLLALLAILPARSADERPKFVLDEIIIGLQAGVDAQAYFGDEWSQVTGLFADCYLLHFAPKTPEQILAECERRAQDPRVKFAEPNGIIYFDPIPFPPAGGTITFVNLDQAGTYVGKVTIRKNLPNEEISSSQTFKVQARVAVDGKITLLTTIPEAPANAATSEAAITRGTPIQTLVPGNNYVIEPGIPANAVFRSNQLKLTYETSNTTEAQPNPTVVTQFEFVLKKTKPAFVLRPVGKK